MKVAPNTVVAIGYVLRVEGEVVDSSPEGEKVFFLFGEGHVLPPGLEDALAGREAGSFRITLSPEEAVGAYDPDKVFAAKRADFPEDAKVEVGEEFYFEDEGVPVAAKIISVDGDDVTLDANAELAGKVLEYEVVIHEVRAATDEEIEHGHVHGEGGVHH
ncbi:MAG: peptidylprolyl isomerase [Rubrobacter sp.]|nr:peptidylprolyl isomerase [Rubrobacter sp.]